MVIVNFNADTSGLEVIGRQGDEVILKCSNDSIIIINPLNMAAYQYTHEYFVDSTYCDVLPNQNLYLFRNKANLAFKVHLDKSEARIISSFEIPDDFVDLEYLNIYMSSEKMNEAYLWMCKYDDTDEGHGTFTNIDY